MKVNHGCLYLTPSDASEILKVSLSQIYRYINQGKLSSYKFIGCQTLDPKEVYDLKARREARREA